MKTIIIVAAIVLAGATLIAVVQNDKKKVATPEVHNASDGHGHPADTVRPTAEAPQLNPAHGLAGHRCDLPVGAPLASAAGTATPAQSPQIINPSQGPRQPAPGTTPAATPVGVKLNPAHGLPGHRCDIRVGAPLT